MIAVLVTLITLAFTYYTAKIDAEHYYNKQSVKNHNSRWLQRALFIVVIATYSWSMALAMGLIFTVLFDQVLNVVRFGPKKIMYFGTVAKWDRFWYHNQGFYVMAKIVLLFAAVLILIYV